MLLAIDFVKDLDLMWVIVAVQIAGRLQLHQLNKIIRGGHSFQNTSLLQTTLMMMINLIKTPLPFFNKRQEYYLATAYIQPPPVADETLWL